MKILNNESLSKYTTFNMGGVCKNLYIPESTDELVTLLETLPEPRYLISGGSNLLINDIREFENVILLREFDKSIENLGEGRFYCGASVRIQTLLNAVNDCGCGGAEYLYSLPALLGGIIVMNAGRGNRKDSISNFVEKVKVWKDGRVCELSKEECKFGYRSSVFKGSDMTVLGAWLHFEPGSPEELHKRCAERLELAKNRQDSSGGSFGSVFMECDTKLMKLIGFFADGKKSVHFSKKTNNWLVNTGGSFNDAIKRIEGAQRFHALVHKNCTPEVIIWR